MMVYSGILNFVKMMIKQWVGKNDGEKRLTSCAFLTAMMDSSPSWLTIAMHSETSICQNQIAENSL